MSKGFEGCGLIVVVSERTYLTETKPLILSSLKTNCLEVPVKCVESMSLFDHVIATEAQVSDTPSHSDVFSILEIQVKLQYNAHMYLSLAILPFNHYILSENLLFLQLILQHPLQHHAF